MLVLVIALMLVLMVMHDGNDGYSPLYQYCIPHSRAITNLDKWFS